MSLSHLHSITKDLLQSLCGLTLAFLRDFSVDGGPIPVEGQYVVVGESAE